MTTIETEINGKLFKITLEDGASVEILDGEIRVKAKAPIAVPLPGMTPYPVYIPNPVMPMPAYPLPTVVCKAHTSLSSLQ